MPYRLCSDDDQMASLRYCLIETQDVLSQQHESSIFVIRCFYSFSDQPLHILDTISRAYGRRQREKGRKKEREKQKERIIIVQLPRRRIRTHTHRSYAYTLPHTHTHTHEYITSLNHSIPFTYRTDPTVEFVSVCFFA